MSASLPFDLADPRVGPVVVKHLRHKAPDGFGVCPAEITVGDETTAATERHKAQRAAK